MAVLLKWVGSVSGIHTRDANTVSVQGGPSLPPAGLLKTSDLDSVQQALDSVRVAAEAAAGQPFALFQAVGAKVDVDIGMLVTAQVWDQWGRGVQGGGLFSHLLDAEGISTFASFLSNF